MLPLRNLSILMFHISHLSLILFNKKYVCTKLLQQDQELLHSHIMLSQKNQCKIVCVFLYNKVDVQNELLVVWWNYLRVVWWCSEALLALCTES